jgi:hypothetical protein
VSTRLLYLACSSSSSSSSDNTRKGSNKLA